MSDVRQWLSKHGLSQLADVFEREQIDLLAARTLSEADIKELGLPLGVRSKLRAAIQDLQVGEASPDSQVEHSASNHLAERRQLTILFCDLVDSTRLSQRMDPERMRDLMQTYQQTCRQVIEKYEGHVAQYLGDGLMVYFGWPRAHEDNAERAVHAALELVSAVAQLTVKDGAPDAPVTPLQVRIGIATGAVVVGETGAGDASVPKLAVGETPNLAARLQGLASPNQIVVGVSTQRLLCGEPGIGKSRITQAVREQLRARPHATMYFQCSPYHINAAFHPFIEQFERTAGIARDDSADEKLDKMERALGDADVDVSTAAPLMATLLSLPGTRYPASQFTPQKQKEKTLMALADRIMGFANKQPTLMLFEDAHWADPTSKELLDILVRRIDSASLMLMMTYRPDFSPPWVGQAQASLLTLSRLSRREADMLVTRITKGRTIPTQVLDHILAKTDGIPLFVEEMTKAVLESKFIKLVGENYEVDGALSLPAIPSTLQDSLMARLDRLAAGKEIAQVGACIGREFSHELIEAVAGVPHARLTAGLAELIKAELIFEHGVAPRVIYVFKHALVKDAAYASLLHSRREALHTTIATALEQRFPEVKSADPAMLAQHFTHAGCHESAVPYWESAAKLAMQRFAVAEAIRYF